MDFMGAAEPIIDEVRINKRARTALWIGVMVSGTVSIIMFLLYFYTHTFGDRSIKITPSEGQAGVLLSFALAAYGFLCSGRAETDRQKEDADKEIRQGEILYDDDELATTEVHDEIARLQATVETLQMELVKARNGENANAAGEDALYESNVSKGYGGIDEDEEPIEEAVGDLHVTDSGDAAREEVLRFLSAYPTWGFNVPRMQSWGVKQGYTELSRSRISSSELHEVIKELVQEHRVYTRFSSTGSTLYQIAR